jgi:RNA-directed DNA polymerase
MTSRLRSSRRIFRTTSTSSGTVGQLLSTPEVEIPKETGGVRMLGIPTVADRIAQSVVKARLEPVLEPLFHADSYGYRPGRSALDAVGAARQRCWRSNWVLDLDIKAFFDSIDTELLMRAVCKHATSRWEVLYIERWLKAPVQMPDGTIVARTRGTPQGGVISPLLANLFLHYAFDVWMTRHFPAVRFERYADDAICHCASEEQATTLWRALGERFAECGLTLHPAKIVYCKDSERPTRARPSTSWATRSGPGWRRTGTGAALSPSRRRPAAKPSRRSARR